MAYYDDVVAQCRATPKHCKFIIMPKGAMKHWEHSGVQYNKPPRGEVAWVRVGTTKPAKYGQKKMEGEIWFLGSAEAWALMDWMAIGRYAKADTGIVLGECVSQFGWQKNAQEWTYFNPTGGTQWVTIQSQAQPI